MPKSSLSRRRTAVGSGLVTGLSTVVVSGAAAAAAVVLAQKLGRGAETDGLLAAYAVYLVLALAAQAFRVVALPDLARAAGEGRLGGEVLAYAATLTLFSAPAVAVAAAARGPIGDALTGTLPPEAAHAASGALVWLVLAAVGQLYAALAASALAARDSYGIAAFAYAAGAVAGLALFVALADRHGVVALAWGVALSGAIAAAIPLAALVAARGAWPLPLRELRIVLRLWRFLQGAAVPLALQGLYLIGVRLAADQGVGQVTTFGYAYLVAAFLVAATAASLSLVSSVPLTRRGVSAEQAAAHVVHTSWLSLAVIVGAAGVFALVGGRLAETVLGDAFSGDAGRELGRLVVYLGPWMVVMVALSLTFPLLFVLERARVLVPLGIALPLVQVPVAWGLARAAGLAGIALSLAATTLLGLAVLMAALSRRTLTLAAFGLGRLAVVETSLAALSFGTLAVAVGGVPAAVAGLAVYALLLAALRPRGLRDAWSYVRALH